MFERRIKHDRGLLLPQCNSIHTFFVFSSLDVIFLSEKGLVVRIIQGLRPWRIVLPIKGAVHALEMGEGAIEQSKTEVGDRVVLIGPV